MTYFTFKRHIVGANKVTMYQVTATIKGDTLKRISFYSKLEARLYIQSLNTLMRMVQA